MSNSRTPPGGADADWRIERTGQRAVWTDDATDCAHCGETLDLDRPHYYAEAVRSTDLEGRPLRTESRWHAFCDEGCFRAWRAGRE
ncbi:MAG: hypothetical protein ABEJ70_00950 [Halobacteriaceae archaeon]